VHKAHQKVYLRQILKNFAKIFIKETFQRKIQNNCTKWSKKSHNNWEL